MWSACKILDQNIFDVMISASIGVFNSDQLKIVFFTDLVFLAIAFSCLIHNDHIKNCLGGPSRCAEMQVGAIKANEFYCCQSDPAALFPEQDIQKERPRKPVDPLEFQRLLQQHA